ncbi:uncharacterized protein N7498_002743 [Penicillium cinerascens]|uniref:Pentatricopeptide repeat domain-containing protein n=1 Tax=Penicillium cinerascens TaxID=70096 RepID=A0A9W9TBE1_9EURO|nr:uncharacterized protein N7498_002743 [Penicillium cinerascens]KAJ5216336.1 hypothetical protein N7498_002743 [Penicillium cinerascens]
MRPALLRLLKRPSAFSILNSLAATPVGVEQLESRYTRLRCRSRCAGEISLDETEERSSIQEPGYRQQTGGEKRPFSFAIYEIESPSENRSSESSHRPDNTDRHSTAERVKKNLRLQQEQLEFESDIGHTKDIGTRLVDSLAHRHDCELWEELLRFRQRHYGDKGTQDIWEGLTIRLDGVKLPVTGERADFFWQSFVDLGLKRHLFLKDVVEYAVNIWETQNACWSKFYRSVVGGLLDRGMQKQAVEWHQKLQASGLARPDDLVQVIQPAIHPEYLSASTNSLKNPQLLSAFQRLSTFQTMIRQIPGHQVYGSVIPALLRQGYGEDAISLHAFLIRNEDHPKSLDELQPLMEYVKKYGFEKDFTRIRDYAKDRFEEEITAAEQQIQPPHRSALGHAKENVTEGKPFKDEIGARLFATRALTFDMILGTLKMLGVSAIGPRTVREMAIRAHSSQDILDKLKMLRQSGISIRNTVFTRLVQKLAVQNRDILLSDLLGSDQHPDVLEDVEMQESLLVSYYMARDSHQYKISLAVLAELFPDTPDLLDIHFRKHIAAGEFDAAIKVVDELALRGRSLNADSVDYMAEKVLTPRRLNRRPPPGKLLSTAEEAMFIFKVMQRVVPAGVYVSAAFWVELLKRLGMSNHWVGLRECCLWLAREYSNEAVSQSRIPWDPSQSTTAPVHGRDGRMVKLIFTPQMQHAIVHWGFKLAVNQERKSKLAYTHPITGAKLIPWTRGIILLRELEQAGLALQRREIRRAARSRLAMLFSRWCPSQQRMNRMLRRENPYSLEQVAVDILRAWGNFSLFNGMEVSNPRRLVNPSRTKYSRRRTARVILPRRMPR